MKNNIKLSTVAILATSTLYANSIGYSSIASGGVTTTTKDMYSIFNNPAMLDHSKYTTNIGLGAAVAYTENGLIDGMDKLDDINFEEAFDSIEQNAGNNGTNAEILKQTIIDGQNKIIALDGTSANININGQFAVNYENWAVGVSYNREFQLSIQVDPNKTDLIVDAGSGNYYSYDPLTDTYAASTQLAYENSSIMYALDNGDIAADLTSMAILEVPVAYKHEYNGFDIGGAIKLLKGTYSHVSIDPNKGTDNLSHELKSSEESKNSFGLDLGVHKRYGSFDISAVFKNLNKPTFTYSDGFEYSMESMAKIGTSYNMFDNDLTIAFDAQLNKTINSLTHLDTQMMNIGLSYEPLSWLGIKGGIKNNIVEKDENKLGNVYTAGFNFGTKWLQFALAGEMSSQKVKLEDDEVSKYMGVRFELISRWGSNK